jgi:hypothetical protein
MMLEQVKEKTFLCLQKNKSKHHDIQACYKMLWGVWSENIHTNTLIPNTIPYCMVYEVIFATQKPFYVKSLSLFNFYVAKLAIFWVVFTLNKI